MIKIIQILKNTTFIDSENNFLFTKKDIYALGIRNIALIESNDKILVVEKLDIKF